MRNNPGFNLQELEIAAGLSNVQAYLETNQRSAGKWKQKNLSGPPYANMIETLDSVLGSFVAIKCHLHGRD
jgi:hypothetical protein